MFANINKRITAIIAFVFGLVIIVTSIVVKAGKPIFAIGIVLALGGIALFIYDYLAKKKHADAEPTTEDKEPKITDSNTAEKEKE